MKREEQIIEAGTYHLCGSRPPKTCGHNMHELAYINRNLVFEAGAKWADETMIDKVCKWLKENLPNRMYDRNCCLDNFTEYLIEDLRKYLEK